MSGMNVAKLGWVIFAYAVLGGVFLLLGYFSPALSQATGSYYGETLNTALNLTFLFAAFFLAYQGYKAATFEPPDQHRKESADLPPPPMVTCRCGRRFMKTQDKQSECPSCFFLSSAARVF